MRRARPPVVSAILHVLFLALYAFAASPSAYAGFAPPPKYEYAAWNNLAQYTKYVQGAPCSSPSGGWCNSHEGDVTCSCANEDAPTHPVCSMYTDPTRHMEPQAANTSPAYCLYIRDDTGGVLAFLRYAFRTNGTA
jgi:hypothetical protein